MKMNHGKEERRQGLARKSSLPDLEENIKKKKKEKSKFFVFLVVAGRL